MKCLRLAVMVCALVVFGAISAHADALTFTETITASGQLDGANFTNALVTLTLTGNTSSITNPSSGLFHISGPATVTVTGDGSDAFTDTIAVFSYEPGGDAGFIDVTTEDILDDINTGFSTYNLTAPIGPLSGAALFNPGELFDTSSGSFDITKISGEATFTAETDASTAVPEPSSLLMLTVGLAGIFCGGKRQRSTAA